MRGRGSHTLSGCVCHTVWGETRADLVQLRYHNHQSKRGLHHHPLSFEGGRSVYHCGTDPHDHAFRDLSYTHTNTVRHSVSTEISIIFGIQKAPRFKISTA